MKNKSLVLGIIAFIVVAVIIGAVALGGNKESNSESTNSTSSDMNSMDMNSPDKSTSSNDNEDAVASDEVEIEDYKFAPATITVKVGTKVTWTNKDDVRHDVVADEESADAPNGPLLAKGQSYSFTFNKAGTYTYHCSPHPYMTGTVIVTE